MDMEAWHAAVHGVTKSWTWLCDCTAWLTAEFLLQGQTYLYLLTSSFCSPIPYDEKDIFFWY